MPLEERQLLAMVTNPGDTLTNGAPTQGTLRWAIDQINNAGGGVIDFAGGMTINPLSPLPAITAAGVVVDGGQLGSVVVTGGGGDGDGLVVDGDGTTIQNLVIEDFGGAGIYVDSGDNAIQDNVISGNGSAGISLDGASVDLVIGNLIGTDITGTMALGNVDGGIEIFDGATGNTVGGTTAAARNIISGNAIPTTPWGYAGVDIYGTGTTGNVVEGNFIGTDITGTKTLGNANDGVGIFDGASDNIIGGTTASARNLISGNGTDPNDPWSGVGISDAISTGGSASTTGNVVEGNFIGTDITGTKPLGNSGGGVAIFDGASGNTVGGTTASARNVISGNGTNARAAGSGVSIDDTDLAGNSAGTTGNMVEGNFIGTDVTGTYALGNAGGGVAIYNGASANTVGGTIAGARNIISGNAGDGVDISDEGTSRNVVQGDFIGTDVTGTKALGNADGGVSIFGGASGNTIGGTTAAAGNIISGNATPASTNGYAGVEIDGAGTTGNVVEGNLIGTDVTGTKALRNANGGVDISDGATNNIIGGTTAGARNLISGNATPTAPYGYAGVDVLGTGTTGNAVEGNFIGTDITGTNALGNANAGVAIYYGASGNTIGGTTASARNLISGNGTDPADPWSGVEIDDTISTGGSASTTRNLVEGNFIGTDITGTKALGNNGGGVGIDEGASDNIIGGITAGAGNLVSGNIGDGVDISDQGTSANLLQGNIIGTDITGTKALANADSGVNIFDGASGNTIGGTTAVARNIISGNNGDGLEISGHGTSANLVQGDFIGTDITGTMALGNAGAGVSIFDGASANTIGGATASACNIISGNATASSTNGYAGVQISDLGTTGNVVEGNFIGTDITGTMALGNPDGGIAIFDGASGNTIGGATASVRNIISGNATPASSNGYAAVEIFDPGTTGNVVEGNFIGTDLTGTIALGNAGGGVSVFGGASANTIGGKTAGSGNVISGNQSTGVYITGTGTTGNLVAGNLIGTDITGTVAIGNADQGVLISGGAASNTIGGSVAGSGNIISGNHGDGVDLVNSGTNKNLVAANIIGADITGGLPLGNGGAGVRISNGASQNMIGGATSSSANIISGNFGDGVDITSDSLSDKVDGNHIGVNAAGTQAVPNGGSGIVISGANHVSIGGAEPGQGNVISANNGIGIFVFGAGTIDNTIQGNLVGTDENGSAALGNGSNGVEISDGASNNTVGGTAASKGNVISGNGSSGIFISGAGTTGNLIEGDLIGTNYLGTVPLGNHYQGVFTGGSATANTIGGTTSGSRNVISANNGDGIDLDGSGTNQNLVEGNLIGTDITGAKPIANLLGGVQIQDAASDDTVGGTVAGAGNLIAFNHVNGVQVGANTADNSTGNAILANTIYANGKLGIDLGNEKNPTGTHVANHASGPNNLQNAPVLTKATSAGSRTTIIGTLSAAPDANFRIEFFSNPVGTSQGQKYLGFLHVTTNRSGSASFSFSPTSLVATGLNITATATDPKGNTSEFSSGRKVART